MKDMVLPAGTTAQRHSWRLVLRPRTAIIVLLLMMSVAPIWLVRYPPLQDYPDLLMQGAILTHWGDASLGLQDLFSLKLVPVPRLAALSLLYLFGQVFEPEIAGKLTISVYLLVFPLSVFYLIRSSQRRETSAELAGFLFTYNFWFFQGSFDYLLAMAVAFCAMGFVIRFWDSFSLPHVLAVIGFSILCYFSHLMGYLAFTMIVGLLWLATPGRRWERVPMLAAAVLPGLALFIWYFLTTSGTSVSSAAFVTSLANKLFAFVMPLLVFFRFEPFATPLPITLANLTLWIALAAIVVSSLDRRKLVLSPRLLVVGMAVIIIILVAPVRIGSLWRFDDRLVLAAYLLLLAGLNFRSAILRLDLLYVLLAACIFFLQVVQMQVPSSHLAQFNNAAALLVARDGNATVAVTVRGQPITPGCHQKSGDAYSIAIFPSIRFPIYSLLEAHRFKYSSLFGVALLNRRNSSVPPDLIVYDVLREGLHEFLNSIGGPGAAEWNTIQAFGCASDLEVVKSAFPAYAMAYQQDGALLLVERE